MDKHAARQAAQQRRARVHDPSGRAAQAACAHVTECLSQRFGADLPNLTLAGFLAIGTEIDPMPAMLAHPGPVCVPVVQGRGLPLAFHRWAPDVALVEGAFGVNVPRDADPLVPDIMLVPGLAFDKQGHRLGYGGGYYDRTLAHRRAMLVIGIAYDAQIVADLIIDPHDARLDLLCTPTGLHRFDGSILPRSPA